MKKKIISFTVVGFLLSASLSFAKPVNPPSIPITLDILAKELPFPMEGVKIYKETPIGNNIYEVIVSLPKGQGAPYAVVYATKDFAIIGNLFKNKQNQTSLVMNQLLQPMLEKKIKNTSEYVKTHVSELDALSVAMYKPQKANGKIMFVFTDTECPACQEAKKHLTNIANKTGYTIRIIPMAEHPGSIENWNDFICGHKTFKDYVNGNYKPEQSCASAMNYVGKASQLAQRIGIFATPTFVTSDGKIVVGYNPNIINTLN